MYRVEEHTRTIYVESDVPPSQWDSRKLGSLFATTDAGVKPMRHSKPKVQTKCVITEEQNTSALEEFAFIRTARRPQQLDPLSPIESFPSYHATRMPRRRILFYHKHNPHYGFTNFSPHPVKYRGKIYPTNEHLFQSLKFQGFRDDIAEHIRLYSPYPSVAFSEARRFPDHVRPDWKKVNIQMMDKAIYSKFVQHSDLKAELLATGDAELVEDSNKDAFWGIGADGRGSNELGKALERLRARLRKESH